MSATRLAGLQIERPITNTTPLVSACRQAGYALLTGDSVGDRLPANPMPNGKNLMFAGRLDRGCEPFKTMLSYKFAAERSLIANDLSHAINQAQLAIGCGARGQILGELKLTCAEAYRWQGHFADAMKCANEALLLLPPQSASWFRALREKLASIREPDDINGLLNLAYGFEDSCPSQPSGPQLIAMAYLGAKLCLFGLPSRAKSLCQTINNTQEECLLDPLVQGYVSWVNACVAHRMGDMAAHGARLTRSLVCFERAGDHRTTCLIRVSLANAFNALGLYQQALALSRRGFTDARRLGLKALAAYSQHVMGLALGRLGLLDEAQHAELEAACYFTTLGDDRMQGASRAYLADILHRKGHLSEAESEAQKACKLLESTPAAQALALAILSRILVDQHRGHEALPMANQALLILHTLDCIEEGESLVRLVHAQTLNASGNQPAARNALNDAKHHLLARASTIANPTWQQSFLRSVPENALILKAGGFRL